MRITVIGAGPIGLEAALAATREGHEVTVLEAGEVGATWRRWPDLSLFTPWSMNTTAAGRDALGDPALGGDTCPTARALVVRYLEPLAARLEVLPHHTVRGIARGSLHKGDRIGQAERASDPFRLLIDTPAGEVVREADAVADCTGTATDPSPIGMGGLRAPGEVALRAAGRLRHGPVAVDDLAGGRVALVGDGASAATALVALLATGPATRVIWLTRTAEVPGFTSPPDDPLPARRTLHAAAVAARSDARVTHLPGRWITRVTLDDRARLSLHDGTDLTVDAVVGCTGFRPDLSLHRELQVHSCYASEGPMKLAAALLGGSGDCLAPQASGPDLLRSPEPRFFVLGAKSYGRRSDFLLRTGHRQITEWLSLLRD